MSAAKEPGREAKSRDNAQARRSSGSGIGRLGMIILIVVGLIGGAVWAWPRVVLALNTVRTDDAYVAGHVTYVASRVAGTVLQVHVDDNVFVRENDLLVELDPEPYQIALNRAKAAVATAEAQVQQAISQGRAMVAGVRAAYNNVKLAQDQVVEQIAKLRASLATLKKAKAQRELAQAELSRAQNLFRSNSGTQQVVDQRTASYQVAAADELEAFQRVHVNRAALGLPSVASDEDLLRQIPPDLEKESPMVRAALADLINAGVKLGLEVPPIAHDPETVYNNFVKHAPGGDLDAYLNTLLEDSPAVRLARAGLEQARRALDQAELDLRDTKIHAAVAGFVNRRVANPGNRVQAGQGLMAIRPLEGVWIDANFKETQLCSLRIGQAVDIHADAYPGRVYRGRVSGFSAGTGASTALLPPENATGNFVKVVQRLPVRIDLVDGNPTDAPLFIGLSVEPVVKIKEPATGPFAGSMLQRPAPEPSVKRPSS
ncbi:MAG: HlyD family secretion protein [Isosphaeraceae bacterium]